MTRVKHKYNYFYKITNNLNNHFYYGVHSTDNLDDGYMGSGTRLHYAYKKYGMENFTKEILKFFDTREKANEYEAEIVNEDLIRDNNCYNVVKGGAFDTTGMFTAKDKDGNTFIISKDDPRYLSGELIGHNKNSIVAKDKDGNTFIISKDDPRYLSGELLGVNKGKVSVKDKFNHYYSVSISDPRYLSGELIYAWCNKKHSSETKEKMRKTHEENHHQQGQKNSQYGTCWIYNNKESIKIKKEDLEKYLAEGWIKGRKMKF